jgi:hypothetical protein
MIAIGNQQYTKVGEIKYGQYHLGEDEEATLQDPNVVQAVYVGDKLVFPLERVYEGH